MALALRIDFEIEDLLALIEPHLIGATVIENLELNWPRSFVARNPAVERTAWKEGRRHQLVGIILGNHTRHAWRSIYGNNYSD